MVMLLLGNCLEHPCRAFGVLFRNNVSSGGSRAAAAGGQSLHLGQEPGIVRQLVVDFSDL